MINVFRTYGWALLVGAMLLGCENTVEPLTDFNSSTFAIHGYLDMRESTQKIRVEALRPTVLSDSPTFDGVEVTSVDLSDNSVQVWRDSTVTLVDGTSGTVFLADFTPQLGRTYSLSVRRNGTGAAGAVVQLPVKPALVFNQAVGDTLDLKQRLVLLSPSSRPTEVVVSYVVDSPEIAGERTVRVSYGDPGNQTSSGWELDIALAWDRYIVLEQIAMSDRAQDVILKGVSIRMIFLSDEWANPEKESNLENAHGFLGSVGEYEHKWVLEPGAVATLGYQNGQ